ncbi:alpha-N-acetylglucosaminidase [Actinomadura rudentiformis]|uniref:Alpha-N-acetylglucosaminidase n=1 Tax=Actinomadura rudentiformis TaxID=359158 RepID=A0A6H9YFC1_9ACTN|nr:alpha-N-acetylglucosaminidase [Actinomadura rudentiformis]KAB2340229.1 alpha-N-acetylglucosaminidase [Actinomadura rudentiformis]
MTSGSGEQPPPWAGAVHGLARRVLGPVAGSLRLVALGGTDVRDGTGRRGGVHRRCQADRRYEYEAGGGVLTVAATDGVSASVGLHHYLRERCGLSVDWDTVLPLPLTSFPESPLRRGSARVKEGYYLNFCTFSYTMPYWDWSDWEREIDWMALHGITMPLAITGHEAVLRAAYSALGLDDEAIRDFLGGPGYLPFQFMGCLDGFAGPLPSSWIESHRELGARILDRERALGMTPVLPAFTGHVPREIASSARAGRRDWQGFETWVLDPADPLYVRIGAEITSAQIALFGTDHLYAADPFIEMIPVDADPAFPGAVAAATLNGLRAADPDAAWVMQAWPFSYQRGFWTDERVTTFLGSIPGDRMLVADLWAEHDPQWERLDQFAGKPWLWCALLNFGGRTDPVADLRGVPAAVEAALAAPDPPTGLGLAMEATRNNPVFFELVTDQIWNPVTDVDAWLDAFVTRRYGGPGAWTAPLQVAWRGLVESIYDARGLRIFPEQFNGVITAKPSYARMPGAVAELRAEVDQALWYRPAVLAEAWERMVEVAEHHRDLVDGPLGHDLAEVGIAFMARVADRLYLDVIEQAVERTAPPEAGRFLRVFDDLERMLAARREYTFQRWESKALSWATNAADRDVLVENARRIITAWGPTASPLLDDYAGRHWAGLVGGYYRDRWELWARGLGAALATPGGDHEAELQERLRDRTEVFLREGPAPAPPDLGDLTTESRRLVTAYAVTAYAGQAGSPIRPSDHDRRGAR